MKREWDRLRRFYKAPEPDKEFEIEFRQTVFPPILSKWRTTDEDGWCAREEGETHGR